MFRFQYRLVFFALLALSIFCGNALARVKQGYFVKFPDDQGFLPMIVGGNGEFLVGESDGCKDLSRWTKAQGVKILQIAPPGHRLFPKAVSTDGKYVTGVIQRCPTRSMTDTGIMFWWSATGGLKILTPFDDDRNAVWQMDISSDGKTVEFFCPGTSSIPTCPGSTSEVAGWKPMARLWTQKCGFQILGKNVKQPFDFIKTVGDFRSFVYGHMLLLPTDGLDMSHQALALTLRRRDGKLIDFDNLPTFSDITASGYNYGDLTQSRSVIMNKNVSLIALPDIWPKNRNSNLSSLIWNSDGKELPIKNLPFSCNEFVPEFINDRKEIIGIASCAGVNSGIEMHVFNNRAQTISTWLTDEGVKNDIGDYTGIRSVSDDGKTILGFGNMCQSVGSVGFESATSNHINISSMPRHEFSTVCNGQAFLFVAHISKN